MILYTCICKIVKVELLSCIVFCVRREFNQYLKEKLKKREGRPKTQRLATLAVVTFIDILFLNMLCSQLLYAEKKFWSWLKDVTWGPET